MTRYEFEVDNQKTIRIWDTQNPNESGAPFMLQPEWPSGQPWDSKDQAESWVQVFIEELENPESRLLAGNSPDTHPAIRPEPEPAPE
jgi:hypothetical protein